MGRFKRSDEGDGHDPPSSGNQGLEDSINLISDKKEGLGILRIPTRSSGATIETEGEFSASGWSFGGDVIRRNIVSGTSNSEGDVTENPFEEKISKAVINPENIEIGILYGEYDVDEKQNKADQTIKIPMRDITDVRIDSFKRKQKVEASTLEYWLGKSEGGWIEKDVEWVALVFGTEDDVFRVGILQMNDLNEVRKSWVSAVSEEIKERVERVNSSQSEVQENGTQNDGETSEPLEQIEKLKDLHDKGVITKEEFEEKRSDLLDRI